MKQDQFSKWHAIKVKAKYDYTCAKCGSKDNIQAHDPTKKHKDWREGIALCGNCHSKEHPDIPKKLFLTSSHQPYWPNISARSLADEFGCHSRTIIRRAKNLNIPIGIPLSEDNKQLIKSLLHKSNKSSKPPIMSYTREMGTLLCPFCKSVKIYKSGITWSGKNPRQRYTCRDCHCATIKPKIKEIED